jgi:hypothetical protein
MFDTQESYACKTSARCFIVSTSAVKGKGGIGVSRECNERLVDNACFVHSSVTNCGADARGWIARVALQCIISAQCGVGPTEWERAYNEGRSTHEPVNTVVRVKEHFARVSQLLGDASGSSSVKVDPKLGPSLAAHKVPFSS